ncbi:RDD family protein [Leeuwenhoekiella sp. W20_SRS_FM14]|uniref:RDD family protein n=1 Tax=Leeuwenhoekiella sp. W20_SRS_FM14 TaxID=3240270 RepID=UPI003F9A23C1
MASGKIANTSIRNYTDLELVKIVTVEVHKHHPDTIKAAERELSKRSVSKMQMASLVKAAAQQNIAVQEIQSYVTNSGVRFLNFTIDFVVFILLILAGTFILDAVFSTSNKELLLSIGYGMVFILFLVYYGVSEYFFQKTLGKYFTKTKVVNLDGSKPGALAILIRTLCRLIPFDRLSFLLFKKGFHDKLSHTQVIKD